MLVAYFGYLQYMYYNHIYSFTLYTDLTGRNLSRNLNDTFSVFYTVCAIWQTSAMLHMNKCTLHLSHRKQLQTPTVQTHI